jgi:hypothetical protein
MRNPSFSKTKESKEVKDGIFLITFAHLTRKDRKKRRAKYLYM